MIQHVPRDGTGRFGGGADETMLHTESHSVWWVAHVMARLFREIDYYTADAERLRAEVTRVADLCLLDMEAALGRDRIVAAGKRMPVMIIPDLELETIGRRPYDSHPKDMEVMGLLTREIERRGQARWGVEVLAGPYHPLRAIGYAQGRTGRISSRFQENWGHEVYGPLLRSSGVIWVHIYQHEDEKDLQGATHEGFTYHNVRWQFEQILASGTTANEVIIVDWVFTEPNEAETRAICRGIKRVLDERDWPWRTHVAFAGGWHMLAWLVEPPVLRLQRSPLKLNIPADRAGRVLAETWNERIARIYAEEFGVETGARPVSPGAGD